MRALSQRRVRDAAGEFWVEGVRQFVQAFDAQISFDTVVFSRVLLKSDLVEMLVRRLKGRGVRCVAVTPEQFRTVCTTERASGIGAVARQRWATLEAAGAARGLCTLVVEEIRSAGNLGTILRTAEATGVGGVVLLGGGCDPFDPAVVRASMGGIFHLKLCRTTHEAFALWAKAGGVRVVGLSPEAQMLWTELGGTTPGGRDGPVAGPVALLLGEERSGVSARGRALCGETVRLPMAGRADSLNVGVAAGVMLYELVRREGEGGTVAGRIGGAC